MPSLKTRHLFISHVWRYTQHYETIKTWFDLTPNFAWKNHSVPINRSINIESKATKSRQEYAIEIKAKITNRIQRCHGVVILSGMYSSHSEWIDYELDEAIRLRKPIVGIKPWGKQRVPRKITVCAKDVVNWRRSSVIRAIRLYVGVKP